MTDELTPWRRDLVVGLAIRLHTVDERAARVREFAWKITRPAESSSGDSFGGFDNPGELVEAIEAREHRVNELLDEIRHEVAVIAFTYTNLVRQSSGGQAIALGEWVAAAHNGLTKFK